MKPAKRAQHWKLRIFRKVVRPRLRTHFRSFLWKTCTLHANAVNASHIVTTTSYKSVRKNPASNHIRHVWHSARAPREAWREREKFFSAGHRACNAQPAYRRTRANPYSWHIILFVSDAKSCMACMSGIWHRARAPSEAKRGASAKRFFHPVTACAVRSRHIDRCKQLCTYL